MVKDEFDGIDTTLLIKLKNLGGELRHGFERITFLQFVHQTDKVGDAWLLFLFQLMVDFFPYRNQLELGSSVCPFINSFESGFREVAIECSA